MLQFMNGGFVYTHCLLAGETFLTLRACPVYFYSGGTDFESDREQSCLLDLFEVFEVVLGVLHKHCCGTCGLYSYFPSLFGCVLGLGDHLNVCWCHSNFQLG